MAYPLLLALALGQATVPAPPPRVPQADEQPDDIVVEGYRRSPDRNTVATPPAAVSGTRARQTYAYSERLAKCAARSRLSNRSRLRAVVDGEFNSATQILAQDRLKRIYLTCSESPSLNSFTSPPASDLQLSAAITGDFTGAPVGTDAAPLGRSIYDRGAFTVQALKQYAPDLRLTRAQTGDPAVQARFNAREVPRNRFRLAVDYKYFEVAVCIVRLEPRLSVRLALSDGQARFSDIQATLIDRARACVGGARHVQVDPTQFRLYIADAVYRWAVAARGTSTLIDG